MLPNRDVQKVKDMHSCNAKYALDPGDPSKRRQNTWPWLFSEDSPGSALQHQLNPTKVSVNTRKLCAKE